MRGFLYVNRKENGFTLIEVIISLAIISVIVIAFFAAIATAGKALLVLQEKTIADSIAQSIIETVKQMPYSSSDGSYTYIDGQDTAGFHLAHPDYSVWSVVDWSGSEKIIVEDIVGINWDINTYSPVDTDNQLQRIEIVIKHGAKEVVALENFKVDR
jgi:type II secretion system protein I